MKTNKKNIILIVLALILAANIAATICLCTRVYKDENKTNIIKYSLYVGLNDKETYKQEILTDDAKEIINDVCTKYVDGFTIQDATGMWVDEEGQETYENTIVCYFDNTNDETIHEIADELLNMLNQNSILIEKNEIVNEYYSGN